MTLSRLMQSALLLALAAAVATAPSRAQAASEAPSGAFAPPPGGFEEYSIGPYDLLAISVFEFEQLDGKRRVTSDGTITLPLLGEIHVGGLTPHEAEDAIELLLRQRQLLRRPEVSVFVDEFVSSRVSVQGAVGSPGPQDLLGRRTLLEMIGAAGGLHEKAGKRILVYRPFAGGGQEKLEIDAERLFFEGDPALNIRLQPGDIVMVPFERTIRIYVTGAVRNPNVFDFPEDEPVTVLQAIASAGGTTERANESRITVIRRFPNGAKRLFEVNLKRIKRGREQDLMLAGNDTVVVKEAVF